MKHVIITENDESQWDDKTGVSYNYPAKYNRILTPGTKVIYYKGKLKDKQFEDIRLSNTPHYFGVAIIGDNYLDKNASKKEYYSKIADQKNILPPRFLKAENIKRIVNSNRVIKLLNYDFKVNDLNI